MNNKFVILPLSLSILLGITFVSLLPTSHKLDVKSAKTHKYVTEKNTPTSLPTASPSATLTPTQYISKVTPTPTAKIIGAWYWKSELGKSLRYLGLDKNNNEIWTDTGDPTPTPTEVPHRQGSTVTQKSNIPFTGGAVIEKVNKLD